jgi:hypothetical protein
MDLEETKFVDVDWTSQSQERAELWTLVSLAVKYRIS